MADGTTTLEGLTMKIAQWIRYPAEYKEASPLFALTTDDGAVLSETDTEPTARGSRELAREWGVEILPDIADGA
jgi:hypothetical protein